MIRSSYRILNEFEFPVRIHIEKFYGIIVGPKAEIQKWHSFYES